MTHLCEAVKSGEAYTCTRPHGHAGDHIAHAIDDDGTDREVATWSQGYNGWSNYETWSVGLIIDNDPNTYAQSRAVVRDAIENGEASEYWTEDERKRYRAADALRSWVEEQVEDLTPMSDARPFSYLVAQLVRAALGDVTWEEIAANYVQEIEESEASGG